MGIRACPQCFVYMAVYSRDEYAERHRAGPGFWLWLAWVVATVIGSVVGSALAEFVFGWKLEGIFSLIDVQALGGLALGLCVGTAQALVLGRYLRFKGALEWIGATALGRIARVLLISVLTSLLL